MNSGEKECGSVGNNLVSRICMNGSNDKAQEDTRRLGARSLGNGWCSRHLQAETEHSKDVDMSVYLGSCT